MNALQQTVTLPLMTAFPLSKPHFSHSCAQPPENHFSAIIKIFMNRKTTLSILSLLAVGSCLADGAAPARGGRGMSMISQYNITWHSPSTDHTGQLPLGNGDIAAGVYAIQDDALYLLLSKNDAFNYNGDLFKTGRVRLELSPNPFKQGLGFKQTLNLATGSILIETDKVKLRVWANAHKPIYHIQMDSSNEINVKVNFDSWERFDSCSWNLTATPLAEPTQDKLLARNGRIISYFAVGDRSVHATELKYYEVEHMADECPDPYRFNTFGNLIECPQLQVENNTLKGRAKSFDIRIHALCSQTPDLEEWLGNFEKQAASALDVAADWHAHCAWWLDFWQRSWIYLSDNSLSDHERGALDSEGYKINSQAKDKAALVAQSYNMFRYLMACQSRGRIQTKFNGGLFTQPLRYEPAKYNQHIMTKGKWLVDNELFISHEDDRLWGRRFTFMNQRLLYWPLLMSGDRDLIKPFFDYYWNLLPIRTAITMAWFGHQGCYYRENIEPTGGERDCGRVNLSNQDRNLDDSKNGDIEQKPLKTAPGGNDGTGFYHSYYFTCGLELVTMMIEHAKYTGDAKFRDEVLIPSAREVILFFDKHYPRDAAGQLRIDPGMVLETFWVAVNSSPDIGGLRHNLAELLLMDINQDDRKNWQRFYAEIPEVPLHKIDGKSAIAPAQQWSNIKKNDENGELYPVFPFRCFGSAKYKDLIEWTMRNRTSKDKYGCNCWTQDQIHWAYAGNASEAKAGLTKRFTTCSTMCRFPFYGAETPDSCPDFDHFGAGSTALQRMLVQEENGKILLLPAWPKDWDVDFKLHLAHKTVISGKVKNGKLSNWDISPATRKEDVIVHQPQ